MLVSVAGSIGAGKSTVARAVAECLEVPLHSIDDDKRAVGARTPEFDGWVASGTPFPDRFRTAVFERTLVELAKLGRSSMHVIVEETFHRKAIRDPFFDRAASLLSGFVLVEVIASESTIIERLAERATKDSNHLAGIDMYHAFAAISDPQDRVDHLFRNDGDFDGELDACCRFLSGRLRAP